MEIVGIERVLVAVANLEMSGERWRRAGFGIAKSGAAPGLRATRLAAGAIPIDLCAADGGAEGALATKIRETASRGGGIIGWSWGIRDEIGPANIALPQWPKLHQPISARIAERGLPEVMNLITACDGTPDERRARLVDLCGPNPNTVDYLEHIVVMTPVLEDAIAALEANDVPCKRIREAGRGMRQAFFKLEQTVIEVVGPSERAGCWGLAFMCVDIARAVACARGGTVCNRAEGGDPGRTYRAYRRADRQRRDRIHAGIERAAGVSAAVRSA